MSVTANMREVLSRQYAKSAKREEERRTEGVKDNVYNWGKKVLEQYQKNYEHSVSCMCLEIQRDVVTPLCEATGLVFEVKYASYTFTNVVSGFFITEAKQVEEILTARRRNGMTNTVCRDVSTSNLERLRDVCEVLDMQTAGGNKVGMYMPQA